jgi:PadR family transcriptional regulator, regulatory protein AphA
MSIRYAILGLLSWKPATGYELKKVFEESSTMYWSGNNNQIYKSLLQLANEGFVTSVLQHQESLPSKKTYTIADKGIDDLKEWVKSAPEAPELRKIFLIQLAWADMLNEDELSELLQKYEDEVQVQLLLHLEKKRRGLDIPNRSKRESFLWDMISENLISAYENELAWIKKVRQGLKEVI